MSTHPLGVTVSFKFCSVLFAMMALVTMLIVRGQ